MYIVVHHKIKNADKFFGAAESVVSGVPAGLKALQFYPSVDRKQAICLWEGKSAEAVKEYLEPKISAISDNTYYGVDSKVATGLPVSAGR
jgi:hypothetical protein